MSAAATARAKAGAQKREYHNMTEYMAAIGATKGWDGLPIGWRAAWKDRRNPRKMRALGWLMDHTMARDERGARWTAAHEKKRGYLTTSEAAKDLGWSHSNSITVFDELIEDGYITIDDKRHIHLVGDPPPPQYTQGEQMENTEEDDENLFCTEKIPTALLLHLQSLDEKQRLQAQRVVLAGERAKKALAKDALAAARARYPEIDAAVYREIDYMPPEETRGRPKLERVLSVELTLKTPLLFSVQKKDDDLSTENPDLSYKTENEPVQKTHPYVAENREDRVSECESEATEPPTHLPEPEMPEDAELVARTDISEAHKEAGYPLSPTDPLLAKYTTLAREHEIPARSVGRCIVDKAKNKPEGYITSAGAIYEFVKKDLGTWIRSHRREIEYDRKLWAQSKDAGVPPATMNKAERIALLEGNLEILGPTHAQYSEWLAELENLRRDE